MASFIQLRRDVMYLTMDTAVRHSMRDTFLASGNSHAYQVRMHDAPPPTAGYPYREDNSTIHLTISYIPFIHLS